MRYELKRFVYMCDGWESTNSHCHSVQVIDAVDERSADAIARDRGWSFHREVGGARKSSVHCGNVDHVHGSEKMGNPKHNSKRDPENCEHKPVRVNDHFYLCTKCGKQGSERWANALKESA